MKIGIIIASQTGHTNAVALKLKEKLTAAGHNAVIEQIIPAGEVQPRVKNLPLKTRPNPELYDALVFGAPVMAFSLSPIMTSYLAQVATLKGKKTACFATKGLAFKWTGGTQAVGKMKKSCLAKGGDFAGSAIVVWASANRDQQIAEAAAKLGGLF